MSNSQEVGIVIQARFNSSRLKGKILKDINGKPALQRVIERACRIPSIDQVVVATTTRLDDDATAQLCHKLGVPVYRGPEDDVLARYYGAAKAFNLDHIVRITADCPMLDPQVCSRVIDFYLSDGRYDYVTNRSPATWPDGLDTEIFSFWALAMANKYAEGQYNREHVTPWLYTKPSPCRMFNVYNNLDLKDHRWTLDTLQDLQWFRNVYKILGTDDFGLEDIIDIQREFPSLVRLQER